MAFHKTGEAPILQIYCSCGNKITGSEKKCGSCAKKDNEKSDVNKQDKT